MPKQEKLNVGVFFGSRSPEHDVSIITAQLIISGLQGLGHAVTPIYINKAGEWLIGPELGKMAIFTDPQKTIDTAKFNKYYLDLEQSHNQLIFRRKGLVGQEIKVEIAFPALHGSFGEDGTIQGFFEMIGIPYVGCDVVSSGIAMDKVLTKQLYLQSGIPTTKFIYFGSEDWGRSAERILHRLKSELQWPVFVKPARLGSSIGIAKVHDVSELKLAIEVALHYDSKILVEESVENLIDATVCVLGNEEAVASLIQESVFEGSKFFTYEEKYLKGGGMQLGKAQNNIFIPARLDEKTSEAIRDLALRIFKAFGCSGIARVDFLYDSKIGKVYANEINPLPGTLYHHLWEKSGLKLGELLDKLLSLAMERHAKRKRITYTFASDVLKKPRSSKLKFRQSAGSV
ncbi:MAG TPA: D-alanine--D-alanine ligase family protein [Patescibacteria group bacterium]|nr:D-alanine--D-alanine ligase family protein [Patescibacteria group bacterium]